MQEALLYLGHCCEITGEPMHSELEKLDEAEVEAPSVDTTVRCYSNPVHQVRVARYHISTYICRCIIRGEVQRSHWPLAIGRQVPLSDARGTCTYVGSCSII